MTEERERVEPRTISMLPKQWAIVEAAADTAGLLSISAGVRRIIDEWATMTGKFTPNAQEAQ